MIGSPTNTPEVVVQGLTVHHGRRKALSDVSFELSHGVTCLLGPNGSGKSTLISVLAGLLRPPSSEQVMVRGHDLTSPRQAQQIRSQISLLPQRFSLMGWASVSENLDYAAWAKGIPTTDRGERVESAAAAVGLTARLGDKASSLSGGMRQRLGFACATIHGPSILLLDEPTVGIDAEHRIDLRRNIREYGRSATVLFATHVLEDARFSADRLLILHEGHLRFDGGVDQLGPAAREDSTDASALEQGYVSLLNASGPS